jgi:hypothetical protein
MHTCFAHSLCRVATAAGMLMMVLLSNCVDTQAQTSDIGNLLYLPLILKPVPEPTVDLLHAVVNITPDCHKANSDYSGELPLTVGGPARKIGIDAHVRNANNKSLLGKWILNGVPYFEFPDTASGDDYVFHRSLYSSLTIPCTGQLPNGTYIIEIYVDGHLKRSGTLIVN